MAYFIHREGQRFGPYTMQGFQQHFADGLIVKSDYVWTEGMANWITVEEFLELSPTHGAIPVPAQQPATKHHVGLWIVISAVLVMISIILFVLSSPPRPEDSFDRARLAYMQHDQRDFDRYVDVQSVLGDWTDQAAADFLQANRASVPETIVVQGAVQAMKSAYLPKFSETIDHLVVSGTLTQTTTPDESDQTHPFLAGLISSELRELASSQLSYEGIASKAVSGSAASLDVNVRTPLSNQPVVVKLEMHRDGDHWRVVAVQDMAELLQQLGASRNP